MRDMEEEEEVKADGEMGQFLSYFFFFASVLLFYQTRPKSWRQRGGLGKKTTS